MYHFSDGWVTVAMFVYVIAALITWGIGSSILYYVRYRYTNVFIELARQAGIYVAVFAVLVIAINLMSFGAAHSYGVPFAYSADAAKVFGLTSGKSYPLVLGERLGGASVKASASAGIFTARASVDVAPGSALSVGFDSHGKSYILELPVSELTFIKSTTAQPNVVIHLDTSGSSSDDYGAMKEAYTGPCKMRIQTAFLSCDRVVKFEPNLSSYTLRRGLAPIVAEGFDSATVTVTPEMYDKILGKS